jgi:hypothetical protein
MDFRFLQRRWCCDFWDTDAGEMLPARLCFEHAESLYMLARRGRGFISGGRTAKFDFFNAIGAGRGAISLTLDESQYQALRAASQRKTAQTRHPGNELTLASALCAGDVFRIIVVGRYLIRFGVASPRASEVDLNPQHRSKSRASRDFSQGSIRW